MGDLFDFEWPVPRYGFEIVNASRQGARRGKKEKYLALRFGPDSALGPSADVRRPLEHTGLFREFAELRPASWANIVDFASRFGWLFESEQKASIQRPGLSDKAAGRTAIFDAIFAQAEPVHRWRAEIREMSRLVEIWDASQKPHFAKLNSWFRRTGETFWFGRKKVASQSHNTNRLAALQSGDLYAAALYSLQDEMNEKLHFNRPTGLLHWEGDRDAPRLSDFAPTVCSARCISSSRAQLQEIENIVSASSATDGSR